MKGGECMHLVMCGHFWSHDKDGGHTIQSGQKPHATCKPHGSICYRTGVMGHRSLTLREQEFSTFLASVTLTLTRWPSYKNWPTLPADTRDMQIWTSYTKAFESYRLTDRQTYIQTELTKIIKHATLRVINDIQPVGSPQNHK